MGQALSKHPGGRPTKYNRAILDTTQDYITNYENYGDVLPQVAGLAQVLDVTRETVIQWCNDESKPEFSYMVSKILSAQERKLLNGGLESRYNSSVTKLLLTKHGYSEKQDNQGVTVNIVLNDKPMSVDVTDNTLTIDSTEN